MRGRLRRMGRIGLALGLLLLMVLTESALERLPPTVPTELGLVLLRRMVLIEWALERLLRMVLTGLAQEQSPPTVLTGSAQVHSPPTAPTGSTPPASLTRAVASVLIEWHPRSWAAVTPTSSTARSSISNAPFHRGE